MLKWAYLGAGGVLGTFARYALSGFVCRLLGTGFPYGTLMVNLIGCFCIGFFAVLAEERFSIGPDMRLFLMAGFCGAFTTFSTFMLENADLIKNTDGYKALGYIVVSVVAGFLLFRLGVRVGGLV